jgi:hypothetical protein
MLLFYSHLRQSKAANSDKKRGCIRVLIDERGDIVDLVVDDHVKVLLGGVSRNLGEGESLIGHGGYSTGNSRKDKKKSLQNKMTLLANLILVARCIQKWPMHSTLSCRPSQSSVGGLSASDPRMDRWDKYDRRHRMLKTHRDSRREVGRWSRGRRWGG